MAYTLLAFLVLLPFATLVTSFLLELRQDLGLWRLLVIVGYSILYTAAIYATFVLSTWLEVTNLAPPSPATLLMGLVLSVVGLALGWMVRRGKLSLWAPVAGLSVLLKALNGSFFRWIPILDLPALVLLVVGGAILLRSRKNA